MTCFSPWYDGSGYDSFLVHNRDRDRRCLQAVPSLQGSWGRLAGAPACWPSWHRELDSPCSASPIPKIFVPEDSLDFF